MVHRIKLEEKDISRYITTASLETFNGLRQKTNIRVLIDTGAFNSMIDLSILNDKRVLAELTGTTHIVSVGGYSGIARGCIIYKMKMGDMEIRNVFAMAYPFNTWLADHIILGANTLNNWKFTISRKENLMTVIEDIPDCVLNKSEPYKSYCDSNKYIAVQEPMKKINDDEIFQPSSRFS